MKTIYDTLKADLLVMRKTGAKKEAGLLTFLLGEIDREGKDHSDAVVTKILQRTKKQLEKSTASDPKEILIIGNYLPREFTEAEIVSILRVKPNARDIGSAMKELKLAATECGKTVNGQMASRVIREHLANV